MDVFDFNYVEDMIGAIEFGERDGRSANGNFVGNPDDTCQISKVYVDEIKGSGNASDFTISRLISDCVNSETNNGCIVAEARQVDLESENVAREGGLEVLDMVVGHGTAVSHGDSNVEEEIFEQKEVVVKVQIDRNNIEPANLFVQLPNVGEKVMSVVSLDVYGQDEGKVMSDDDLICNQGTGVIEGFTNWWDPLCIETAIKSSEEECRNGDFGEVCNDASRKILENEDKIGLRSDALIPKKRGRENQTEKKGEYFVSDLVWGKVRSHPWWPGQILEPSSASDNVMKYFKKDSYLIGYFGDQTFAWNDASKILPFGQYFQEMEKQRGDETFRTAMHGVLDEVSRRVECGLACGCLPERVLDRVKGQVVNSAGIQVQCSKIYYDGDSFPAAASFVPAELVGFLKSLAETSETAVSRLQFTTVRAQLLAFIRWKACREFPLIEKSTRSLENDAGPMALHEVELVDEVLEVLPAFKKDDAVTVKGDSFTKETSYKRKHPGAEGRRKKKRCVLESMPAISSCLPKGEKNTFEEEFDWDMALASSLKRKREISVEKVREGHLLPTENNEAASLPRKCADIGKLRQVTGKLEKSSSFKSTVRTSRRVGKHRKQMSTSHDIPPIDEMFSKMVIVAQNPMETCSLLKSVAGFFVKFRNSICLVNNSMPRNEESAGTCNTENVSELVTAETFKLEDTEDLCWISRILGNNLEDQVFLEHDTHTENNSLITDLKKDGGIIQNNMEEPGIFGNNLEDQVFLEHDTHTENNSHIIAEPEDLDFVNLKKDGGIIQNNMEEPGIFGNNLEDQVFLEHDTRTENNSLILAEPETLDVMNLKKDGGILQNNMEEPGIFESEKATVISEPQGLDDANRDGDRDTNAMVTTDAGTSKSEEYSPTLLILNFNNLQSIPSIKNLNKIFNCYGPLHELDTEILSKGKRAKIVFQRRADADTAFSSAGKYRTFGPSLVSYRLKYLPKTYNAKRSKKNKAPAALQSGM